MARSAGTHHAGQGRAPAGLGVARFIERLRAALPLANLPHCGTGIALTAAGEVLAILCAAPTLAAIVLTEVNPSHDPSGHQLDRDIQTVAAAIADGIANPAP